MRGGDASAGLGRREDASPLLLPLLKRHVVAELREIRKRTDGLLVPAGECRPLRGLIHRDGKQLPTGERRGRLQRRHGSRAGKRPGHALPNLGRNFEEDLSEPQLDAAGVSSEFLPFAVSNRNLATAHLANVRHGTPYYFVSELLPNFSLTTSP